MWAIGCTATAVLNAVAGNLGLAIVLGCLVLAKVLDDRLQAE